MNTADKKVFIIAEAGVNHNGSMELAKQLIDAAVEARVDAVKFQTFIAENVISAKAVKADYQQDTTGAGETQLEMVKKLQLSFDDFVELQRYCGEKGIRFLSTPFDLDSVDFLATLNMGLWKIPSGEITNLPYLRKIAATGDPVIFSTGMANLEEIATTIGVLTDCGLAKENITVLHCNTEYPTPMKDVNLQAMNYIGEKLGVKIGYSDHTLGIEVPVAAVALGATVIEKHFTLDRNMEGPDHRASLEPQDLKAMVEAIRNIELALSGSGIKEPSESEKKNTDIARKSLHFKNDLDPGHVITPADLIALRPGNGVSPMEIDRIVGKKLQRAVGAYEMLTETDIVA